VLIKTWIAHESLHKEGLFPMRSFGSPTIMKNGGRENWDRKERAKKKTIKKTSS